MWVRYGISALLVVASTLLQAQLTIENPKHLEVPDPLAQALFLTASRVVETEFHCLASAENTLRIRLVLGQTTEHLTENDSFGNGSIYLERWDENKFAFAAMRLVLLRIIGPHRQERMLREIVSRAHDIAPVRPAELHKETTPSSDLSTQRSCLEEITDARGRGRPCGPLGIPPNVTHPK